MAITPVVPLADNGAIVKVIRITDVTDSAPVDVTNAGIFILQPNGLLVLNTDHPIVQNESILGRSYEIEYDRSRLMRLIKNTLLHYDKHYVGDDVDINFGVPVPINFVVEAVASEGADAQLVASEIEDVISERMLKTSSLRIGTEFPPDKILLSDEDLSEQSDAGVDDVLRFGASLTSRFVANFIMENTSGVDSIIQVRLSTDVSTADSSIVVLGRNEYPVAGSISVAVINA